MANPTTGASPRDARLSRKTAETDVSVRLNLDGTGKASVDTGIGFLDHMLVLFARHGLIDLELTAKGDLHVDFHHTVEDTGIVLGQAVRQALGDKTGLVRYGCAHLPMDETLARVVIDLSGRAFLEYRAPSQADPIGGAFSFQLVEEFVRAFANNLAATLHVEVLYGRDSHHMAEAIFKGLARALDQAVRIDPRVTGIPSTKDLL
jgi:imidazoleglycerol-phosphate dehydratase